MPITIRKATSAPDDPLMQAADKLAPALRQAFIDAVNAVKGTVDEKALADAIASGDVTKVMALLDIQNKLAGALQGKGLDAGVLSVQGALQATFAAGANVALLQLPKTISVDLSFNLMNPKSVEFLNKYTFDLIQQVSQDTKDAVQEVVTRAFQEGGHPFQQAREIKQFIGLTQSQEQAVTNYRNALMNGGTSDLKDALSRALRDGRYDKTLLRAIQNQQGVPQDKIDAMVQRYRERFIQYRARNIARTESIRAANHGQIALWKQAVDQDLLAEDVERVWIISGDADTCDECEELDGETAGLDEEFAPGIYMPPDPHPSCRCTTGLTKDTMKRAA